MSAGRGVYSQRLSSATSMPQPEISYFPSLSSFYKHTIDFSVCKEVFLVTTASQHILSTHKKTSAVAIPVTTDTTTPILALPKHFLSQSSGLQPFA